MVKLISGVVTFVYSKTVAKHYQHMWIMKQKPQYFICHCISNVCAIS